MHICYWSVCGWLFGYLFLLSKLVDGFRMSFFVSKLVDGFSDAYIC